MNATKVVQINSECGRGSTGKIAVAISKLLTQKGIENYVFYSGNHRSDYICGRQISGKLSIRFHQLLSRLFGDQGFHSYFETKRLVREIRRIEPDRIVLHNLHGYYANMTVLFKFLKQYGKPVYWTLHDCWAFTGHCTHFTLEKCEKWKDGCFSCTQKHKYPYSWFFDRSKTLYRKKKELFTGLKDLTIITPSKWLAELAKESFLGKYPIEVINNGVNLDVFKPTSGEFRKKHHLENKRIILGVSSVWSNYKGLDVFLELFKRLDSSKFQIILVGTDEKIDKQLPKEIISIHRTQNQKQLAEIYTVADVFVNPTREENYPSVNMEAIACGTPVVTFNTGGCPEIVNDDCGAVVCTNTTDELEEKIISVLHDFSEKDADLSAYAARFNEQRCFEKYVETLCN